MLIVMPIITLFGPGFWNMFEDGEAENSWMARNPTMKARVKAVSILFFSVRMVHFSTCQKRLKSKFFILQVLSLRR